MNRSFFLTLRTQLIWLTGILALVRFFVVICGSNLYLVHLSESFEDLPTWQVRLAPIIDRATLFSATIVLVLGLPGLVRTKKGQKIAFLDESIALGLLVFVGTLAINALAHKPWSLGLAYGVLAILFLAAAMRLAVTSLEIRFKLPLVALMIGSALPLAWKALFELGVTPTSSVLAQVRTIADCTALCSWAGLIFTVGASRKRALEILPIALTALVAWFALDSYSTYHHILTSVSGLWYTTFSQTPVIILTCLATYAVTKTWIGRNRVSLSFVFLLLASAAHGFGSATALILQALGMLCLLLWARFRQSKTNDLPSIIA